MQPPKPSFFFSIIRAFSVGMFTVLGSGIGFLFLAFLCLTLLTMVQSSSLDYSYHVVPGEGQGKENLNQTREGSFLLKININEILGSEKIKSELEHAFQYSPYRGKIRGIFLCLNSPGGSVLHSDRIYRLLKEYKERYKLTIYAYVDGICASGGMYIAAAADRIYASEISLIGGVGVWAQYFNVAKGLEKVGIEGLTLTAGKEKDNLNPFREWEKGEEATQNELVQFFYDHFLDILIENRPQLSRKELIETHGARVYPAAQATEYSFIDGYNLRSDEVEKLLAEASNIEGHYFIIEQAVKWSDRVWKKVESLHGLFSLIDAKQSPIYMYTRWNSKNPLPSSFFIS